MLVFETWRESVNVPAAVSAFATVTIVCAVSQAPQMAYSLLTGSPTSLADSTIETKASLNSK